MLKIFIRFYANELVTSKREKLIIVFFGVLNNLPFVIRDAQVVLHLTSLSSVVCDQIVFLHPLETRNIKD